LSDDATIGIVYFCGTDGPETAKLASEKPMPLIDYKDVMRKVQLELLPRVKLARSIVSQSGIPLDTGGTPAEKIAKSEELVVESVSNDSFKSKPDANAKPKKQWPKRVYLLCLIGIISIIVLIAILFSIL
jgi:hypothetical protein